MVWVWTWSWLLWPVEISVQLATGGMWNKPAFQLLKRKQLIYIQSKLEVTFGISLNKLTRIVEERANSGGALYRYTPPQIAFLSVQYSISVDISIGNETRANSYSLVNKFVQNHCLYLFMHLSQELLLWLIISSQYFSYIFPNDYCSHLRCCLTWWNGGYDWGVCLIAIQGREKVLQQDGCRGPVYYAVTEADSWNTPTITLTLV